MAVYLFTYEEFLISRISGVDVIRQTEGTFSSHVVLVNFQVTQHTMFLSLVLGTNIKAREFILTLPTDLQMYLLKSAGDTDTCLI